MKLSMLYLKYMLKQTCPKLALDHFIKIIQL